MIFNLVKAAKQLFIDRNKTGVAADNVEDAIKLLNSDLSNKGSYKGNIDELLGVEHCGGYRVYTADVSGNQPFTGNTYYYLEVPRESNGALQRATQYSTGETKSRFYSNNKWNSWTSDKSNTGHTHDDIYYTETETNKLLDTKQSVANANNQTQLLSKFQVTTNIRTFTFKESIYDYNEIALKFTIANSYTYTYTIPKCCLDTKNHEIFIAYNLSQYFENIELQFDTSTSGNIRITSQGTDSGWNTTVYVEIYGVGKR